MSERAYKQWIGGEWQSSKSAQEVRSPYSGDLVAKMAQCDQSQVEAALESAHSAFDVFKKTSRYLRSRLLAGMAQKFSDRRADLVERIVSESGKPRMLADIEVNRAIMTFTIAAEEAKRLGGEVVPVDIDASGRAYGTAHAYWVPRGTVLAITPFNFPLNLAAHKVAPALAVGAPVIVKPPPQAPGATILMAEIFEHVAREISDASEMVPLAALQVISGANEMVEKMVVDHRVATLSFTGSDKVGWMLQQKAIRKKIALELGGNAAVIIDADANLQRAATRCAFGGFSYAGQTCISVQRILVHEAVASKFEKLLVEEIKKLKVGDPNDKDTVIGPLIDQRACERLASWLDETTKDGGRVVLGGKLKGSMMEPTVLSNVKPNHKMNAEEAFGPVVTIETYADFARALEVVNRSKFGLQAGVFTDSNTKIRQAIETLDVGGVIINEIPTYRADNMPYGGVKDSGLGREGVKYTMQDFCEIKTVVTWQG